jgi:hypothetical protein
MQGHISVKQEHRLHDMCSELGVSVAMLHSAGSGSPLCFGERTVTSDEFIVAVGPHPSQVLRSPVEDGSMV